MKSRQRGEGQADAAVRSTEYPVGSTEGERRSAYRISSIAEEQAPILPRPAQPILRTPYWVLGTAYPSFPDLSPGQKKLPLSSLAPELHPPFAFQFRQQPASSVAPRGAKW